MSTPADDRIATLATRVTVLSDQLETMSSAVRHAEWLAQRLADTERRERELRRQLASIDDERAAEYRRGYGAGFHAGRRGAAADPERARTTGRRRGRSPSTIVPTLDAA